MSIAETLLPAQPPNQPSPASFPQVLHRDGSGRVAPRVTQVSGCISELALLHGLPLLDPGRPEATPGFSAPTPNLLQGPLGPGPTRPQGGWLWGLDLSPLPSHFQGSRFVSVWLQPPTPFCNQACVLLPAGPWPRVSRGHQPSREQRGLSSTPLMAPPQRKPRAILDTIPLVRPPCSVCGQALFSNSLLEIQST